MASWNFDRFLNFWAVAPCTLKSTTAPFTMDSPMLADRIIDNFSGAANAKQREINQ
jgi:hypothetical protein